MTYFPCIAVCLAAEESQLDTHMCSLTWSVNIDVNIRHYQLRSDLTLCKHTHTDTLHKQGTYLIGQV